MCRRLLVKEYIAKPPSAQLMSVPRWPLNSHDATGGLAGFLGFLAKPSSTLGGRPRMALVQSSEDATPELALIAGQGDGGAPCGLLLRLADVRR